MSKRCPKCHGQYDDIYRFCGDCGISLVAATEGASGKSIFYKLFHLDEASVIICFWLVINLIYCNTLFVKNQ